ncbi:MAG: TRAP transporter small permease [Lawsonibacter sp.]
MKKLLNHFEEYLSCLVFMVMLALAFVNVIFRNFAASISFTEEITTSLFVLLCMLGTSIAARDQGHLGLSVVTEFLSEKKRLWFSVGGNLLGVIFSAILFYTGIGMVVTEYVMGQISIALQWPQWIYGSFLPFGAFCMILRFAQAAARNLTTILHLKEEHK